MPLTQDQLPTLQAHFGLGYHLPYLMQGQEFVGLSGMRVLEVGGSLPRELVIDTLGATQWVAVEALRYWEELGESGGGTRPVADLSTQIHEVRRLSEIAQYTVLEGLVENLPKCMEGAFDRIFSIACFEHVHTLGLALEKMHAALAPGGKLFTMFSPIWSAHDGHHLPIMQDMNGKEWSYAHSPIPPWGHLLYSPAQMEKHIRTQTDHRTAASMVYNIYHNQHINRLFTEDYIEYLQASPFTIEKCHLTFSSKIPAHIQNALQVRHPGKKHFSNNGLLLVLRK